MMRGKGGVDPATCPLCGAKNHCGNVASAGTDHDCWCNHADIAFPQALLDQVPPHQKRKACICRNCVSAFLANAEK